ncbi:hypothetical protein N7517_002308 [Penicillium concentricum]|uniref:HNH nuclease domain-containing protein n=1 Tax=Penicillium concentricum TaxID=293559 RepID=A0A9W9STX5_9EURO|nr:uncharacterized protein N7517_002308 [Penicillium concentricum]KAJ5384397.1 hypothetical protein N7517_002308 [Penicillium concentricum]
MTARVLKAPRYPQSNLRIYQDNGSLLAEEKDWGIFKLLKAGTAGSTLRSSGRASVGPGNYIVLDKDQTPITVNLTTNCAPRRIRTHDTSTQPPGPSGRQTTLRNSLRQRDSCCAITGQNRSGTYEEPFLGLEATHVFPVSMLGEWRRGEYRRYITDTRPDSEIGETRLYSAQNGLLLSSDIHTWFDNFRLGVDPDSDYKIIVFGSDPARMGGTRLKDSARSGTNRVSDDLLRWHLRMCVYRNMKANAEPETIWDEDLGEDPMASILKQPDAAERMEIELFTRLGGLIA